MRLTTDVPVTAGGTFIGLAREIAASVLRIIEEGWYDAIASANVGTGDYEVELTERLRDGMRRAADSRVLPLRLVVLPGTESRSRSDVVKPDGRTDIPILVIEVFLRSGEHDPHAIIECKRISGLNARLCRDYVVEGLDRFRAGKYSGNHSTGFMIGYLIAGNAEAAADGINRYLIRKARSQECLRPSNLVYKSWAWRSKHPRRIGSPIELHHAFLQFAES